MLCAANFNHLTESVNSGFCLNYSKDLGSILSSCHPAVRILIKYFTFPLNLHIKGCTEDIATHISTRLWPTFICWYFCVLRFPLEIADPTCFTMRQFIACISAFSSMYWLWLVTATKTKNIPSEDFVRKHKAQKLLYIHLYIYISRKAHKQSTTKQALSIPIKNR